MTDMTDYPISIHATLSAPRPAFEPAPEPAGPIEPTRDQLSIQINTLQREVERLGNVNESYAADIRRKAGMISEFEDRLKDAAQEEELDSDLAKEFADIFEFELSKKYSITINASWSGTITVPFGQDADDLSFDFPFPELSYSCNEFEMDIDEDNTDFETREGY
jgi:hypothetical protein